MKNTFSHRRNRHPGTGLSVILTGAMLFMAVAGARAQTDWKKLERRLPNKVVVEPQSREFGYRFQIDNYRTQVPEEFLTGGAAARKALKRGLAAGRIDSLVGLVLLARLKDRAAGRTLSGILNDPDKLSRYPQKTAAAIPFVLRYHMPDNVWPGVLIKALKNSPTSADSSIIVCLSRYDLPEAEEAYLHAFGKVDSLSQRRIIDRMMYKNPDDRQLWDFFAKSRIPTVQNLILDRLEKRKSPLWPAQADSLVYLAVGDAACRVLQHISQTDTSKYRPLMRMALATARDKACVLEAALRLSADGDKSSQRFLRYRFHESDTDMRVVTALALCRLGDTWGVGACVRIGLKHEKYRKDVIEALESVTGLAYGEDDDKWTEWLEKWKNQ